MTNSNTTNYAKLSNTRKEVVKLIVEKFPEVTKIETISFKMVRSLWVNGKAYVDPASNKKYGYPLWLLTEAEYKTGTKGLYNVPLPTLESYVSESQTSLVKVSDSKKKRLTPKQPDTKMDDVLTEDEFKKELAAAGIEL